MSEEKENIEDKEKLVGSFVVKDDGVTCFQDKYGTIWNADLLNVSFKCFGILFFSYSTFSSFLVSLKLIKL